MGESLWRDDERSYIRVLPEAIGVSSKRCSLSLQRAVCDFGLETSFQKSVDGIREHYGFTLPLSAVGDVTRRHAAQIARKQSEDVSGAHALPLEGAGQLTAEADGSFVRIVSSTGSGGDARKRREVNYQEVRLCASVIEGSSQTFYGATLGPVDTVGSLWAYTAKLAGMGLNTSVHIVADGASWIDTQSRIAFGSRGQLLIDLYHVMEYLGAASKGCSTEDKHWLKTQKRRLKEGRADTVIAELKKHVESPESPDGESPVRCALRYFENRRENLAYDQAIAKGLPLGSGLIESGNKHVIQARMKISGASWSEQTAENFVSARALRANKLWDNYWTQIPIAA